VLLIVRFLTPVQQGYYYTLYSLIALQIVFELGFSFVILQLAAHERAHLILHPDGRIEGDENAQRRLASILQKVRKWYTIAAVLLFATLAPAGWYFLEGRQHGGEPVFWQAPWLLMVLMAALMFQIDPVLSFLEGCGQITEVAQLRLGQIIMGAACAWTALSLHHGLYAPAATGIGYLTLGLLFLWRRRSLLLPLLRMDPGQQSVHWGTEVWPFQWRIAVSWLCSYFTAQIFTPILFRNAGPVVAGQMGMSMSIVGALGGVALAWMSTKSAPFGTMVRRNQKRQLDSLFFRTLLQSTVLVSLGAAALIGMLHVLHHVAPKLSARMVSIPVFTLLAAATVLSHVVQSLALFLRSHKTEPFLVQSICIAVLVSLGSLILSKYFGAYGVAWSYFLGIGVLSVLSGTVIFFRKRREWGYPAAETEVNA
jgi:hypothetical protein